MKNYSATILSHMAAARMKKSVIGYAVKVKDLFSYYSPVEGGEVTERRRILSKCREVMERFKVDYVLLFRVADIAKLVRKKAYRVFFELTYFNDIPAFPLARGRRRRTWFVPYCKSLERYLRRKGIAVEDFGKHVLVQVPQEDELKSLIACAVAERVLDEGMLNGLEVASRTDKLEVLNIVLRDLQELRDFRREFKVGLPARWVRLGGNVFVWRPIYALAGILDVGKVRLSKRTVLKRGYRYLVRRMGSVKLKVESEVSDEFLERFEKVLDGCEPSNSSKLRFEFYAALDENFLTAANRAQVDNEFRRFHYLTAIYSAIETNRRVINPVVYELTNKREVSRENIHQSLSKLVEGEFPKFVERAFEVFEAANERRSRSFITMEAELTSKHSLGVRLPLSQINSGMVAKNAAQALHAFYNGGIAGYWYALTGKLVGDLTEEQQRWIKMRV